MCRTMDTVSSEIIGWYKTAGRKNRTLSAFHSLTKLDIESHNICSVIVPVHCKYLLPPRLKMIKREKNYNVKSATMAWEEEMQKQWVASLWWKVVTSWMVNSAKTEQQLTKWHDHWPITWNKGLSNKMRMRWRRRPEGSSEILWSHHKRQVALIFQSTDKSVLPVSGWLILEPSANAKLLWIEVK